MDIASNQGPLQLPADMIGHDGKGWQMSDSSSLGGQFMHANGTVTQASFDNLQNGSAKEILSLVAVAAGVDPHHAAAGAEILEFTAKAGPHPAATLGQGLNEAGIQSHGPNVTEAQTQSVPDVSPAASKGQSLT